ELTPLAPFNPSRRDNMIGWMAARSDPPHYGRLITYNFPKQKLVYGPRQIDARIDQDPVISQQLSLWNQRGSTVIRGSLLAIPIDQSLIYVQPLYLAASEQGALPELRRVIVAYGNQIAMEPTLGQSLTPTFRGPAAPPPRRAPPPPPPPARPPPCPPWPGAPWRSSPAPRKPCVEATSPPTAPSRRTSRKFSGPSPNPGADRPISAQVRARAKREKP